MMRKVLNFTLIVFVIVTFAGALLGPTTPPSRGNTAIKGALRMTAQTIGRCLFQYSLDHNGHYPEGRTSTEVFQHLMNEKYFTDPSIFSANIPGKVSSENGQLTSANVGWDVTCCVDSVAPDGLPVVFLTGYKVSYQAGTRAIPLHQVPPPPPRTWYEWVYGEPDRKPFIAVCYAGNAATTKVIEAEEDGSFRNFIPVDFDPKGKTYRQLTP